MRANSEPISGVLPVKNGAIFFERIKRDVTAMLRPQDELVVIDDGSTDNSFALIKRWSQIDLRVRLFSNPSQGLVDALNFGVKVAKHRWIARIDVDDSYHSERIHLQLPLLLSGSVAVFSDYRFLLPLEKNVGRVESAIFPSSTSLSLISSSRTPHSSAMFDREAFFAAGSYRKEDFPAEDLSLWLRISRLGKMTTVPVDLLKYTLNPGGISQRNQTQMKSAKDAVIQKIGINHEDTHVPFETWLEEIEALETYPFSSARSLLLLRDILVYEKNSELSSGLQEIKRILKRKLISSPSIWSSGVRHLYWKVARQLMTR
jgi:hypothetical protein